MDNISAIATARGTGGVAIIRISGENALNIASQMFVPSQKINVANFQPYTLYTGNIICDGFTDYGMCVYFKAPKSFTGEDVVEFHCHGGERIAFGVLSRTFELGCRLADRGEFTRRAFLNGKLSLSSAEGLIDMINAQSDAGLRAANMLFREKTVKSVVKAQADLKLILASLAADIDYPEEGVIESEIGDLSKKLSPILNSLKALVATYPRGKCVQGGVNVALCGNPNVGKSSLLNAILGYDRAIVSSEAGTTRDAVEAVVEIGGINFKITDTAGLRDGAGSVESKGIEIAKNVVATADIVVHVSDGEACALPDCPTATLIRVFNKADILNPPEGYDAVISAATGMGIENLKSLLLSKVPTATTDDGAIICEQRHVNALNRAIEALSSAIEKAEFFPSDILSIDITDAWSALGEITGETANEAIISEVFAKFCVGK